MSKPRASWRVEQDTPQRLVIRDTGDHRGQPTVTNDVEAVVQALIDNHVLWPGKQLLYIDSDDETAEIVFDRFGFVSFKP